MKYKAGRRGTSFIAGSVNGSSIEDVETDADVFINGSVNDSSIKRIQQGLRKYRNEHAIMFWMTAIGTTATVVAAVAAVV